LTNCILWSGPARPKGAIDASNYAEAALARGELRCVGATTLNEYKKYIEKDAASNDASSRSTLASLPLKTRLRFCAD
jgi:ATP-dependent Clp protease ATP-binding subunit ClpA